MNEWFKYKKDRGLLIQMSKEKIIGMKFIDEKRERNWKRRNSIGNKLDRYVRVLMSPQPLKEIKYFCRKIKWSFQRATKGWADCDVWNMYVYIARIIAGMTKELKEKTNGYPGNLTYKKWQKILDEMYEGFDLASKDKEFIDPDNLFDWVDKKRWEDEIENYQKLEKSLEYFRKYYLSLWD